MKIKHTLVGAAGVSVLIAVSSAAQAVAISGQGTWETTLQGRDLDGDLSTIEAYYDTAQGITWLADANYSMTTGYDAYGVMDWSTATGWAASLDFNGITGWRLPTTVDVGNDGATFTNSFQGVDYGYNITTHSEMSYMFYVALGNLAYYDASGAYQPGFTSRNSGPFADIRTSYYWSATEYAPSTGVNNTTDLAWIFDFDGGLQGAIYKADSYYAWAVHAGDVGTPATVPLPAAAWLFGSGMLGLIGMSRKRRRC